jgi:hypothetical protein
MVPSIFWLPTEKIINKILKSGEFWPLFIFKILQKGRNQIFQVKIGRIYKGKF